MEALREGAKGEAVAALKRRLNELGYDCGEGDEYDRRLDNFAPDKYA